MDHQHQINSRPNFGFYLFYMPFIIHLFLIVLFFLSLVSELNVLHSGCLSGKCVFGEAHFSWLFWWLLDFVFSQLSTINDSLSSCSFIKRKTN